MSSRTINLYQEHVRSSQAPTLPPPPEDDPIAELERRERKHAHRASRELARAVECRAMIEFLKGTHT